MKSRDKSEIHTKTSEELLKTATDLRSEIVKLKLDLAMNKNKNTGIMKTKKQALARILTILTEKSVEAINTKTDEKGGIK